MQLLCAKIVVAIPHPYPKLCVDNLHFLLLVENNITTCSKKGIFPWNECEYSIRYSSSLVTSHWSLILLYAWNLIRSSKLKCECIDLIFQQIWNALIFFDLVTYTYGVNLMHRVLEANGVFGIFLNAHFWLSVGSLILPWDPPCNFECINHR